MSTINDALRDNTADTNVTVSIAALDAQTLLENLPDEERNEVLNKIGDRPIYSFAITAGGETISDFNCGEVFITIPYTPQPGEDTDAIVIYYIDSNGSLKVITNCTYDPETNSVSFVTSHFSNYAVGCNKVEFTDVASSAWYSKAVTYIVAREITSGIGDNRFGPELNITRADFLKMVMVAYEIKIDETPEDNFDDAGNKYYTNYLSTAKRMGLVAGIGNNKYAPESYMSRHDMAVTLYRVLSLWK